MRYRRLAALPDKATLQTVALPMGLGSVVGTIIGGLIVGLLPIAGLKIFLGFVLLEAASKPLWPSPQRGTRAAAVYCGIRITETIATQMGGGAGLPGDQGLGEPKKCEVEQRTQWVGVAHAACHLLCICAHVCIY